MSGHTEAPWFVDEIQCEDWRVNISAEYQNVASAHHLTEDGVNSDDECMANARLIAAAPELLAALKNLVNDFDKSVWTEAPMLIEARAAIAKAEGGDNA